MFSLILGHSGPELRVSALSPLSNAFCAVILSLDQCVKSIEIWEKMNPLSPAGSQESEGLGATGPNF